MSTQENLRGWWKNLIQPGSASLQEPAGLWKGLQSVIRAPLKGSISLYRYVLEKAAFNLYKPRPRPEVQVFPMSSHREGEYYILKNTALYTYLKLSPQEYFIYSRMDGNCCVKDLVVAYFMEYNILAPERIMGLVRELLKESFLEERPVNLFSLLSTKTGSDSPLQRARRLAGIFFHYPVSIRGIDRYITFLYRHFFFIFFTKPMKLAYPLISATGLVLFFILFKSGAYNPFQHDNSYTWGILILVAIGIFRITLHEGAHAFATKACGREIPKGGFLIYYGAPCFFADTTDIWLGTRREKITVSWAGPYSELILASTLSILVFFFPHMTLCDLSFKVACICYLSAFINLNPLLELDGYFILMDWLEIPQLRKRSIDFIRTKLLSRLKKGRSFSPEEKIFTLYGILTVLWTGVAIVISLLLLRWRIMSTIRDMFFSHNILAQIFSLLTLILFIAPVIVSLLAMAYVGLHKLAGIIVQSKALRDTRILSAILVTASLLLSTASLWAGAGTVLLFFLPPIILSLGLLLLMSTHQELEGSSLIDELWMKSLSMFFLLIFAGLGGFGICDGSWKPGIDSWGRLACTFLSCLFLLLYACRFFLNFNPGSYTSKERYSLVLLIPLSILCVVLLDRFVVTGSGSAFSLFYSISLGLVALTLVFFVPLISNYLFTSFAISFLMEGAALFLLVLYIASMASGISHGRPYAPVTTSIGLLSCALFSSSFLVFLILYRRGDFARPSVSRAGFMSDRERLYNSFRVVIESLLFNFSRTFGERRTREVIQNFNDASARSGWDILIKGQNVSEMPAHLTILDMQRRCESALDCLRSLLLKTTGKRIIQLYLTRIYDLLYWDEREIASQYLFSNLPWAGEFLRGQEASEDVFSFLRGIPVFGELSDEDLAALISVLKVRRYRPDDVLVRRGEPGAEFFIIRRGRAQVFVPDDRGRELAVAELRRRDFFGERALLEESVRTATVQAITDMEVLIISKGEFNRLLKEHVEIMTRMQGSLEVLTIIRSIPVFGELSGHQLQYLASRLKTRKIGGEETVITQGSRGEEFFIIKKGELEVFKSASGSESVRINTMGPGEYFGEIALIEDIPRTATVKAKGEGELLVLQKEDFEEIMKKSVYASRSLSQTSSRRMLTDRRH